MGHAKRETRPLTPFEQKVKDIVLRIPSGTVLAYGEVALLAGREGGARAVVRALHSLHAIPWWRVVRADRTLAPEVASDQARRLRAEGVVIQGRRILLGSAEPMKRPTKQRAPGSRRRQG